MIDRMEQFTLQLKARGLKTTKQRLAILDTLANRPDQHLTAEEIYDIVKTRWPNIGLATVYRNIQLLSEMHLIDKLNLEDGFIRYEIADPEEGSGHHHHHMICLSCGKVFTFGEDLLEDLEEKIQQLQEKKLNLADEIIGGEQVAFSALTREDLLQLIQ